jgi:UDP-glucose 4-epimerase
MKQLREASQSLLGGGDMQSRTREGDPELNKKRVLITGSNGFVGIPLCKELRETWQVRAGVRCLEAGGVLPAGVEPIQLDVTEPEGWEMALSGVDAVVHLAARAHVVHERESDSAALYAATNVEGTRRVLSACRQFGVRQLIYLSSIKAVGEGAGNPYTEESACRPEDSYGFSKREAERILEDPHDSQGICVKVLRPPLVYGPGVKGNFLRLLWAAYHQVPLPIASVKNARSMVYVGNLVRLIHELLENPTVPSRTYHVADPGEPLSTPALMKRLSALMGKRSLLLPCPVPVLKSALSLLSRRDDARRLCNSLVVDASRVERELGWRAPFSVQEALEETVAWYLSMRETKHGNSDAC